MTLRESLATALRRLWRTDAPLTATGLFMVAALGASLLGLWLDPRIIGGAPAWLKPVKFAASLTIYSFTLAWVFSHLPDWPRLRRRVGVTSAVVFLVELAIIDAQAWRGTTSHFNNQTPLDSVLFSVMGLGIFLQTGMSLAVAVALWRQRFEDLALARALRLGMTLTVVGALSGSLMTMPTSAQLDEMRTTGRRVPAMGAHTVGAPDGGPGLPGTGWSVTHGDLRVAHFVGLHAIQALPLLAVAIRRRWPAAAQARLVAVAAASQAGLFLLLLWQALRGQSIVAPDATAAATFGAWAVLTAMAVWIAATRAAPARAHA